jgi:hypothetical protein
MLHEFAARSLTSDTNGKPYSETTTVRWGWSTKLGIVADCGKNDCRYLMEGIGGPEWT